MCSVGIPKGQTATCGRIESSVRTTHVHGRITAATHHIFMMRIITHTSHVFCFVPLSYAHIACAVDVTPISHVRENERPTNGARNVCRLTALEGTHQDPLCHVMFPGYLTCRQLTRVCCPFFSANRPCLHEAHAEEVCSDNMALMSTQRLV